MGLPSIVGQCPECCAVVCDAPNIEWDSRSASKTKNGFAEWRGFESTPPKRYLTITWSGIEVVRKYYDSAWSCEGDPRSTQTVTTGGVGVADPDAVNTQISSSLFVTVEQENFACEDYDPEPPPPSTANYTAYTGGDLGHASTSVVYDWPGHPSSFANGESISGTVVQGTNNFSDAYSDWTDSRTCTLSDENLTSTVVTNALASLPDWDEDWNDTAGSYRNLTTNELTFSVREAKYRFRFQIPTSRKRVNTCYVLEWVERFTPLGGGEATDTPKTWTWDGTIPEDYDPEDSATWPLSPEYTISIPEANGTTTVAELEAICDECE